jgi:hypothetical protein
MSAAIALQRAAGARRKLFTASGRGARATTAMADDNRRMA